MPRLLGELKTPQDDSDARRDLAITHRTTRSFGAAVAVLLLATLVASRSDQAFTKTPANASAAVAAGTIELGDDDDGRSLFDLQALTPTRAVERCLEVNYTGTILPVQLRMRAEADGVLSDYLDIEVQSGSGGNYDSCAEFIAEDDVFEGTLADFALTDWNEVGIFLNSGERQTFRIEIQLQDRLEALGETTSLGFAWEATPL